MNPGTQNAFYKVLLNISLQTQPGAMDWMICSRINSSLSTPKRTNFIYLAGNRAPGAISGLIKPRALAPSHLAIVTFCMKRDSIQIALLWEQHSLDGDADTV
jgi:hypothetical protein